MRPASDFDNVRCECEHIAHTDRHAQTPKGNPGHRYGQTFKRWYMAEVDTIFGRFYVCSDCARDCELDLDTDTRKS